MIPTENKNTTHFKQRLLPNCLPHDLEIVTVNGVESISQYHTPLTVAKFTGKRKKIKSGYFIATPLSLEFTVGLCILYGVDFGKINSSLDKAPLAIPRSSF